MKTQRRTPATSRGLTTLPPAPASYTPEVANGTGVQYLLPATASNFPLVPSGPYFSGSGASRVQELPVSIGNLGRDVARGPGQISTNLAIGRAFDLRERLKFTIRMEAYNLLNHTNFSAPSFYSGGRRYIYRRALLQRSQLRIDHVRGTVALPATGGTVRFLGSRMPGRGELRSPCAGREACATLLALRPIPLASLDNQAVPLCRELNGAKFG